MSQFMILLRNEDVDFAAFSPEDYQKLVNHFEEWNGKLKSAGKLIGSGNLKGDAKTLRAKNGKTVIDGPYSETKEALAGFFLIHADRLDEAVQLAHGCPFLGIGGSVEVRETGLELEA